MIEREREGEPALAAVDVTDIEPAGRETCGDAQAQATHGQEIMVGEEVESLLADFEAESDAETETEIFLETGRAGEALGALNDLREAVVASVLAGPELALAGLALGDRDNGGDEYVAVQGKRCAERAERVGKQPPAAAMAAFDDFADIGDRAGAGEAMRKAGADGGRQGSPTIGPEQGAKAKVAKFDGRRCLGGGRGPAEGEDVG